LLLRLTRHYFTSSGQQEGYIAGTKRELATNAVLAAGLSDLKHTKGQMTSPET